MTICSESAKHAFRALGHLAGRTPGRLVPAAEIAEAEGIPSYYLAKILQELSRHGLLVSTRGRGGGFALARAPEAIRLIEILDAVDGAVSAELSEECVIGLPDCVAGAACPLRLLWGEFRSGLLEALSGVTLADIAAQPPPGAARR